MPKKRQKQEKWRIQRLNVIKTYSWKCFKCKKHINEKSSHIDHIVSGKLGSNHFRNLRPLCPTCHSLRKDIRHSGMRASAIKKGLIPPDYRPYLW